MKHLGIGGIIFVICCGTASAFQIEESIVFSDITTGITSFSLTFDEAPDFFTVDSFGRQATAFNYYVYSDYNLRNDPHVPIDELFSTVIRGSEIYDSVDEVRVRDTSLPIIDSSPSPGGAGGISASVPFLVSGNTLTFSVETNVLTSSVAGKGEFLFVLILSEYGRRSDFITQWSDGSPSVVPIPAAVWLFGSALMGLGWFGRSRGLPLS